MIFTEQEVEKLIEQAYNNGGEHRSSVFIYQKETS